jgi:hypothetical protein
VWRRRAFEFSSGTWYRYGLILACLLAIVAALSPAPFALVLLGFVPLFVVVGIRMAAIRAGSGNQARAQALLPTLDRHLAGDGLFERHRLRYRAGSIDRNARTGGKDHRAPTHVLWAFSDRGDVADAHQALRRGTPA